MSSLARYINHPEQLDQESLYALRTLVARHPHYTPARLLLLHNLFVLHDASFGAELRKAAFLVPDRRVLFDLIAADKYRIEPEPLQSTQQQQTDGRTLQVIEQFIGKNEEGEKHRKPTVADATTNYAAFLLSLDDAPSTGKGSEQNDTTDRLMDTFLEGDRKFHVGDNQDSVTSQDTTASDLAEKKTSKNASKRQTPETQNDDSDNSFFTETLAKIYIKQGRFEKAFEIISSLNANYPNKSVYFADQMRYLRKLIVNNQHKQ